MPILRPLSLERLISNIKTARGWRIKLVAIPNHMLVNIDVRGRRLRLDGAPVVLIVPVEDTTGFHRPRIILHQLAHLWCDNTTGASFDQLARPLPDVPPAVLRRPTNKGRVVACRHDGHLVRGRLIALCRGFRARLADFLVDEYQQLRRQPFSLAPRAAIGVIWLRSTSVFAMTRSPSASLDRNMRGVVSSVSASASIA
ncbi:hypothetical protein ACIOHS_04290 [Streptomyces sp. NPDC088253]|uniref:hypothetical protein n=1 Tax=Streptomyces sp. NPDC088253 TaxID=3365846 RepID=UPI003821AB49